MGVNGLKELGPWEWPPDAGDLIMETLQDRHGPASRRLIAAELGGDLT